MDPETAGERMALWSGKISLGWHFGFPRYDPDTVRPSDRTRLFIFYFQQGSYSVRATRKSRRNVWRYGQGVSPKPCGATSRLSTSDQKWRNVSSLPRLPPREGLDISPLLILSTTTYTCRKTELDVLATPPSDTACSAFQISSVYLELC